MTDAILRCRGRDAALKNRAECANRNNRVSKTRSPPLPRHLFLRPLFAIHSTTARNVSSVRPSTRLGGTRLLLLLLKRELKIAIAFGSSFPRNPSYTRSTIDRGFPSKSIIGRSVWLNTSHYFLRFVLLAPAKMLR